MTLLTTLSALWLTTSISSYLLNRRYHRKHTQDWTKKDRNGYLIMSLCIPPISLVLALLNYVLYKSSKDPSTW